MNKFCPYCLRDDIDEFDNTAASGKGRRYTCPRCHEVLPNRYIDEYDDRTRILFSVIGLSGNGKTCFLASLFHIFDHLVSLHGAGWNNFDYGPGDEKDIGRVRKAQGELEAGQLPDPSQVMFPRPLNLLLDGIPLIDRISLLMYDTAGEVFQDVALIQDMAKYAMKSRVVLCLINLTGKIAARLLRSSPAAHNTRSSSFLASHRH